jgi:glycosyltransferase involved in cell wall biosynthesis
VYNTAHYLLNMRGALIASLLERGARVVAIAPRDEAFAGLETLGAEVIHWRLAGHGMNPFRELFAFRQLERLLAQIRPDIVFNFTIKPVIYGSLAAQRAGCNKTCSMVPGRGYLFGGRGLQQRILRVIVLPWYRRALRHNHRVFFQNIDDRDFFIENGLVLSTQAVVVDGSGVDTQAFSPRRGETQPATFLLVARLLKEKGIAEYVAAARKLKARYPHARFLLLGPFSQAPTALTPEAVARWEEDGSIEYLGEADDVRPYLARCMAFVLPSYYGEGLPRTALEAMAMGKPVITTDWPGCREAVSDGSNGILVPVRDSDALASAMERLLDEPGLAETMGRRSREIACSRFDVTRVNGVVIEHLTS